MVASLSTIGAAALAGEIHAALPPRAENGRKTWGIVAQNEKAVPAELQLGPDELGPKARGCRVVKRTLQTGLSAGVETIEVDNGRMSFTVLPTRGMGIWQARCGNVRLGWDSPVKGPVNPAFVRLEEPDGLGWLAGFNEMLVRCGLEYNGGPEFQDNGILRYGLHGRIANTPARDVEISVDDADGRITVSGTVDEARLFGNKLRLNSQISTLPGKAEITVRDTVENRSGEPGELMLIYHTNFGPPLLGRGSEIVAAAKKVAPYDDVAARALSTWNIMGKETAGAREQCFFFDLAASADGRAAVMLCSPDRTKAVVYRFNKKQLPYFTLWKNNQRAADGYAIGFEPGTNLPNTKSEEKEQGRVITLAPGESRTFELSLEYLDDEDAVQAAKQSIMAIK